MRVLRRDPLPGRGDGGVVRDDLDLAHAPRRQRAVQHLARRRQRRLARLARHEPIDQAEVERLRPRHVAARRYHLDRRRDPDQAGRPLRAARAGQDAERHLRQADAQPLDPHARMGGERDLQPAAERDAVEDRDHRRLARLQQVHDVGQDRVPRRGAELADVGPRDEGAAAAVERDHLHPRVRLRRPEAGDQPGAQRVGGRVHRRVVERDQRDRPHLLHRHDVAHVPPPSSARRAGMCSVRHAIQSGSAESAAPMPKSAP